MFFPVETLITLIRVGTAMRRRQLLALTTTTAAGVLAGCLGDESDGEPIEILDHELYFEDSDAGVRGEVENVTDSSIAYVRIDVYFLDEEGDRFSQGFEKLHDIPAGSVWEFDAMYLGTEPDRIDDYEIETEVVVDNPAAARVSPRYPRRGR